MYLIIASSPSLVLFEPLICTKIFDNLINDLYRFQLESVGKDLRHVQYAGLPIDQSRSESIHVVLCIVTAKSTSLTAFSQELTWRLKLPMIELKTYSFYHIKLMKHAGKLLRSIYLYLSINVIFFIQTNIQSKSYS